MALSKREKYIAMGVGAAVVLFALDQIILTPYFSKIDQINKDISDAQIQQTENAAIIDRQRKLKPVWTEITQGGLTADASEAESQALHAMLDWAQNAGVGLTAVKPERTTNENQFQVISFHVTGNGSTPAIARLLLAFETAKVPVRVDDMQVTPRKEGTDDLTVQLSVSTLCLRPPSDSTTGTNTTVTSAGRTEEVRTWNE